eukprot:s6225_g3.t1
MRTNSAVVEFREYVTLKRGPIPFIRIEVGVISLSFAGSRCIIEMVATVREEVCQKHRKDADLNYLEGSGRSTTPSFVDGSLSRNSSMKGKAMSTCYRDFPARKVTPRRQGGKVRPTAPLPPLSKKIYQWQ